MPIGTHAKLRLKYRFSVFVLARILSNTLFSSVYPHLCPNWECLQIPKGVRAWLMTVAAAAAVRSLESVRSKSCARSAENVG